MQPEELFATVFVLAMFSGVFIIFMGLRQRSQQLEMRHRERMAMIERGHVPRDDGRAAARLAAAAGSRPSSLSMSFGILVVGLGLALMSIIGIAGDSPEIGVGIGGAIVIVGAAFIVRSLVIKPEPSAPRAIEPPEPPDEHAA